MFPPAPPLSPRQRAIVWTCALAGGLLRLIYVLVLHLPTQHVYSDMGGYVQRALDRVAGKPEGIADSLYPPGASWLFAQLHALDPNSGLTVIVQWLLSLGTMALVFVIARRLYGNRAAVLALAAVTLYLPLFHYAGLFLAENPFTFCLLAAYALLIATLEAPTPAGTLLLAAATGLMAGLAASLKATILLPVALTGIVTIVWLLKQKRRGTLTLSFGVALGLATVLLPLSERCTRLAEGQFCLVSTNTGMNALMGHYGERGPFQWVDASRNITFSFQSPSATLRGYTAGANFSFGAYDVPANVAVLEREIADHPLDALRLSLRNVADLVVGHTIWPAAIYGGRDWGAAYQIAFWILLLPAASVWLLRRLPRMLRLREDTLADWLLLTPLLGLALTAFISLGEVRFRIPFDGFVIVLAAQGWLMLLRLRERHRPTTAPPPTVQRR